MASHRERVRNMAEHGIRVRRIAVDRAADRYGRNYYTVRVYAPLGTVDVTRYSPAPGMRITGANIFSDIVAFLTFYADAEYADDAEHGIMHELSTRLQTITDLDADHLGYLFDDER